MNKLARRIARLLPGNQPRYVRCYDNGGVSVDRYTVLLTGRSPVMRSPGRDSQYPYLAMNGAPAHPGGFGQHGFSSGTPADVTKSCSGVYQRPPAIGRKNHLGTRIPFSALPLPCQQLVLRDYKEVWGLEKAA
jgi:hypothetical protein